MNSRIKLFMVVVVIGLTVASTPVGSIAQTTVSAVKVADVNGSVISRTDLDFETNQYKQQLEQKGQAVSEEQLKDVQKQALEGLINQELLFQDSRAKGIQVTEKAIDDRLAAIKQRFGNEAEYQKALAGLNLKESDLKNKITRGLAIEELIQTQIDNKVVISDQDSEAFYKGHPEFFKQSEQVKASHILIKVEKDASDSDRAKAKAKIDEVQKKLKDGEDFAKLAQEYSEGPSNEKGGDLGYFERGQMVKEFEDAAFALKPGEVSGVVQTQFGYHIIKVTDKKPESTMAYDEVKERIVEYLKREEARKDLQLYIEKLRNAAKIERFL
jgi:peptidyl-prolyl cis-trans isomerase C